MTTMKGSNELRLNESTMRNIIQEHFDEVFDNHQVVTSVAFLGHMYIITFESKEVASDKT